ncbi:MAG: DUF438 domain-containing protein [candidate division Zixibacteria bacterium]|nr:DUF438 domain-containing protein [candidate division Zixibacteria bacterium]MDD5425587.1 DUF438 domain-containing protein [candidate division Zixibacteria bacterium]
MSELIDNVRRRRDLLKHLILQLHKGEAPQAVKTQLIRLLGSVPYGEVVQVEQELISEGLPEEEVLRLCDIHSAAMKGQISQEGAKVAPPGHPVHTFRKENQALTWEIEALKKIFESLEKQTDIGDINDLIQQLRLHFNALRDVEKHYQRKENLLFPYLEKHGITGPPKVMWGKHDEVRELLKAAGEALLNINRLDREEFKSVTALLLKPAVEAVEEMIFKEEEILFPMSLDTLEEREWYSIYRQSLEIGFCLYDPVDEWRPETGIDEEPETGDARVQLPSGSFTPEELNAILNTIPFDLTFVDRDDTVRYFTQGRERIFARNRAILGRKVQLCHPPASVHVVQKIIDDFRTGRQDRAPFWINLKGHFIHIEYFALRDSEGRYLGTLEVSQDLTGKRSLEGEQRLLAYGTKKSEG